MDWFGLARREERLRRLREAATIQAGLERTTWKPWAKPVLWLAIPLGLAGLMVVMTVIPDRYNRWHSYPPAYAWAGAAACAISLVLLVLVRRLGVLTRRVIDELKE